MYNKHINNRGPSIQALETARKLAPQWPISFSNTEASQPIPDLKRLLLLLLFTGDPVNVSGIRITLRTPDAFIKCSTCVPCSQENTYILLCASRTHKEHVYVLTSEHMEMFPICYILVFESALGMSKVFRVRVLPFKSVWFPSFLLIEGVNYRIDIYPEITMDMNKGQWTKPVICHGSSNKCFDSFHGAERSFSSGSGHWNLQKYSQNERDVWIQLSTQSIQRGRQCTWGFCSPEQRAFQCLHSMSNASHWCLADTHVWWSIDHPQPLCADSLELIDVL